MTFENGIRIKFQTYPKEEIAYLTSIDTLLADTINDLKNLEALFSEPKIYDFLYKSPDGIPKEVNKKVGKWAARGLAKWKTKNKFIFFIRNSSNKILGTITIKRPYTDSSEITYWISEKYKGYMTNALIELIELARTVGYKELVAIIRPSNLRSLGVVQRAGFEINGTLKRRNSVFQKWTIELS